MKTIHEVKKRLECCHKQACEECPYDECGDDYRLCVPVLIEDFFELVQQLEAKDVKQSHRITELEQELAAVKRERDAAVAIIGRISGCSECANADKRPARCLPAPDDWCDECGENCVCKFCNELDRRWIWRGVCPENTEVE